MPKVVIEFDSDEEKEDVKVGINLSVKKKEIDKALSGLAKEFKNSANADLMLKFAKNVVGMLYDTLDEIMKIKKAGEKK